jgi:hypothetical protein
MAKKTRATELEEAIVQAVCTLDEADGSRIGLTEAIDQARNILHSSYGDDLDLDVQSYLELEAESEEQLDEEDDEND